MIILKIGKHHINTDQVTHFEDVSYTGNPRCVVVLTSTIPMDAGDAQLAISSETLVFRDSDAVALLEWLDANSFDVFEEMAHRGAKGDL